MAPGQMSRRFFLQLIVAIVKIFGDVGDSDEGYQALRILTVFKRQAQRRRAVMGRLQQQFWAYMIQSALTSSFDQLLDRARDLSDPPDRFSRGDSALAITKKYSKQQTR